MTRLDHQGTPPGYYPSAWPGECGGPRRQKVAAGPGLGLRDGEQLSSTTRDTDGWAVMLVQREPGELYLQGGTSTEGQIPPRRVGADEGPGWVERIDPATLEPVARSPELPSGGHLWCGSITVHANGDLYVVNGRWCHRLDPDCRVVAERELPLDAPYNGLLVMDDGNLVMKNLGHRAEDDCWFTVLEPERLEPVGEPLVIEDRAMGRFSADGEHIYATTPDEVFRLRYRSGTLSVDPDWRASYAVDGNDQSDGWDTTLGDDSVWLMDMGRVPGWIGMATGRQRAFRFSIDEPSRRDVIDELGAPMAWNPGPPLYDPIRRVLVHYDTLNGGVAAHRYDGPGQLEPLWTRNLRNSVQMLVFAESGELVLDDAPSAIFDAERAEGSLVVLDIETGEERGRAPLGAPLAMGMFLCPGWDRDVYAATQAGVVTRAFVDGEQASP